MRIARSNTVLLLRIGVALLMLTGILCLGLFAWFEFEARYYQASLSQEFDQERTSRIERQPNNGGGTRDANTARKSTDDNERSKPSTAATDLSKEVFGRLEIPSVGLNVMVLRGTENSTLRRGAGWLPTSAEPGEGNVAIAAHRDTHFRPLRAIQKGDLVELTTLDGRYNYRVDWTAVVDPENVEVLNPTKSSEITLITCYPFYYVGHAPRRFVVRAVQTNTELSSVRTQK